MLYTMCFLRTGAHPLPRSGIDAKPMENCVSMEAKWRQSPLDCLIPGPTYQTCLIFWTEAFQARWKTVCLWTEAVPDCLALAQ